MKSIRLKLILFVSALIVISLISQGIVSMMLTKQEIENQAKNTIKMQANQVMRLINAVDNDSQIMKKQLYQNNDNEIIAVVDKYIDVLNICYNKYLEGEMEEAEAKKMALEYVRNMEYNDNGYLWIDTIDYELILSQKNSKLEGTNRADYEDSYGVAYIKDMIDNSKANGEAFLNFYVPKPNETRPISNRGYSKYFEPWGWVIGTANYIYKIEIKIEEYKNILSEEVQVEVEKLSDNGTVAVFNSFGNLIYYTNKELVGTKLDTKDSLSGNDITSLVMGTLNDYLEYSIVDPVSGKTVNRIAYVAFNSDSYQYTLVSKDSDTLKEGVKRISRNIIVMMLILILLGVIGCLFISESFTKPIRKLNDTSKKISQGNLNVEIDIKGKDELSTLARSFSIMVENIRGLIKASYETASNVDEASDLLSEMIGEASEALESVSAATQEIASGATEQAQMSEEGVRNVEVLDNNAKTIEDEAKVMQLEADDMKHLNEDGIIVMKELLDKQTITLDSIERIDSEIAKLVSQTEEINKFTVTITQIAEQTNMLALNAAIEAARAGEHGKGFAVVADEVRKLAEQSNDSAKEIQEIVSKVFDDTNKVIEVVNQTKDIFKEQNIAVEGTERIFKNLEQRVINSIDKIHNINDSIKEFNGAKQQVIFSIDKINEVTEVTAASTEQVSSSIEEQNAAMQEIGIYVSDLSKKAKALKADMNKFNI